MMIKQLTPSMFKTLDLLSGGASPAMTTLEVAEALEIGGSSAENILRALHKRQLIGKCRMLAMPLRVVFIEAHLAGLPGGNRVPGAARETRWYDVDRIAQVVEMRHARVVGVQQELNVYLEMIHGLKS